MAEEPKIMEPTSILPFLPTILLVLVAVSFLAASVVLGYSLAKVIKKTTKEDSGSWGLIATKTLLITLGTIFFVIFPMMGMFVELSYRLDLPSLGGIIPLFFPVLPWVASLYYFLVVRDE